MTENTLKPKTLEIWLGVRSLGSMVSDLQQQIETVRAGLTGYDAYRDVLRNVDSFGALEDALSSNIQDIPEVSSEDVTRTVDLLRDNFSDYSTYAGDDSSGALSKTSWDEYRAYLLNNGIAAVDGDEHIQLLKDLYSPDETFASDSGEHTSWDSFQTELENNGVGSDSAEATVEDLKSTYTTVSALDREVLGADAWSDVETELVNRGLTSTEASDAVDDLKAAYGDPLDETTKDSFSSFDSWAEFETYLAGVMGAEDAATLVEKLKAQYSSFADFRSGQLSSDQSLEDLLNDAEHGSETSQTGAGVKVWEGSGVTESGLSASAGDVSLRGRRIYLEKLSKFDTGGNDNVSLSYANMSATPTSATTGDEVLFSCDVTNNGSEAGQIALTLTFNGLIKDSKTIEFGSNETRTVRFREEIAAVGSISARINESSTVTVEVNPSGVTL